MTAIEFDDVAKSYETAEGTLRALSGIDLSVPSGSFTSVVGPSGAGKTTLLRLIAGLESPSQGTVRVNGRPVTGPGPDRGLVFQAATLYPWRTVAENVRFGLEAADVDGARADRRVSELLSMVGLADRKTAKPDELSGGMRKRVGIARALAPDPEILLLDEPFSDLDVATRESLQTDLLDLWADLGKTVLMVTHTVGEAVRLSDSVVVLEGEPGRIGRIVDVDLERPRDAEIDRFKPYVNAIREAIRDSVPNAITNNHDTIHP
ncbi:MAG: ABC transporter ATP-binding protein [Halodesulfurarchaeum sp.]